MASATARHGRRRDTFGAYVPMLVLLLLAGLAIEEGLRLLVTVDPAAQADMAGWYVLVLGIVLAVTTACAERPARTEPAGATEESETGEGEPSRHRRRDMVVFLVLVAAYAALLDPLGYALTGVVVVFAHLRVIARYGWLRSGAYTVVMNAAFVALFELAGVVLPAGILRF